MRPARRRAGMSPAQIRTLDDLARSYCMTRAGAALVTDEGRKQWWGACQKCSRQRWLSWCHIFTRANLAVRWDADGSWAWCSGCHRYLDQHWELKRDWVAGWIGERYEKLLLRSRALKARHSYPAMKLYLEAQLGENAVAILKAALLCAK